MTARAQRGVSALTPSTRGPAGTTITGEPWVGGARVGAAVTADTTVTADSTGTADTVGGDVGAPVAPGPASARVAASAARGAIAAFVGGTAVAAVTTVAPVCGYGSIAGPCIAAIATATTSTTAGGLTVDTGTAARGATIPGVATVATAAGIGRA